MHSNIKRGSIVTWAQKSPSGVRTMLGSVTSVYALSGVATVHVDGSRAVYEIPVAKLHRAERAVVGLVAEKPYDDEGRDRALTELMRSVGELA